MVRHGSNKNKANASDLVNFHFSSSPPSQSHMTASPNRRNQRSSQQRNREQQHRRSKQDRASARRKAQSSMFYLHSSADHAFIITRRAKHGYSFSGSDEAVSWEAVRAVKYLVPTEEGANRQECPVCLDSFTCPRITKCGHCFCLSCLLRHVHTQAESNKSQAVKCPCCGLPVHMDDVRVVSLESVQPPNLQGKMTLVKLHCNKECPAPYLPWRGALRHSSPHAAPTANDADAAYSRFTYVDPDLYHSQLTANQLELETALSELQQQRSQHSSVAMEMIFVQMALESVAAEQRKAVQESEEERSLAEQYRQPHAGMYQSIPDRVFAEEVSFVNKQDTLDSNAPRTRPFRAESIDSADSSSQHGKQRRERPLQTPAATVYLDQDTTHFYQSEDGQLCFLSRFNMSCLLEEFTASVPDDNTDEELAPSQLRRRRPLPDVIEGNVLDKESVHLTPDVRKRMPFLSHLPLYTDIQFVELDLNCMLSAETKQKFKAEMEKRRKKRKSKVNAEKRADRVAKQKEEARINELKARIQRIDPNDDFFQISEEPEQVLVGEEFGPAISGSVIDDDTGSPRVVAPPSEPQMSFSAVTVSNLNPMQVTEDSFPSLSTSPPTGAVSRISNPTWSSAPGWHGRARPKAVEEETFPEEPSSTGKGKKSKGKKVLLFSTGGHRGSG